MSKIGDLAALHSELNPGCVHPAMHAPREEGGLVREEAREAAVAPIKILPAPLWKEGA